MSTWLATGKSRDTWRPFLDGGEAGESADVLSPSRPGGRCTTRRSSTEGLVSIHRIINVSKVYLAPFSAMKLMYDSLILSHLQFGIANWGFEWERISKLQKQALRIMTNSRYNAHTEPLFKKLTLLKVKDIFDVQCLKFWYKFVNNKLPKYFRDMFKFNHELHDIVTRNHDCLQLYPTRTSGAQNVLRHHIPELLNKFPQYLIDRIKTHGIYSFAHQIKCYLVDLYSYACNDINCYVCNYTREWQIAKAETCILWLPRNHWLYM